MKQCKNTETSYGCLAKILHWTMAILIIVLLGMGLSLDNFPPEMKPAVMMWHKSLGVFVLGLGIFRLIWRAQNIQPAPEKNISGFQNFLAHTVHMTLYIFMLGMPLSGWLMSSAGGRPVSFFGFFDLPSSIEKNMDIRFIFKQAHELMAWGLIMCLGLHIVGALYHHLILKDGTLKRMLRS